MSPVILFAVVIGVIQGLQYSRRRTSRRTSPPAKASQAGSNEPHELGYPEGSTLFYPILLYRRDSGTSTWATPRRWRSSCSGSPSRSPSSSSSTPAVGCITAARCDDDRNRRNGSDTSRARSAEAAGAMCGGGCLLIGVADHSVLIWFAVCFLAPIAFIVADLADDGSAGVVRGDVAAARSGGTTSRRSSRSRRSGGGALNSLMYAGLATLGLLVSEHPGRVCAVEAALARAGGRLHRRARRVDVAAAGLGRADLRDVVEARPCDRHRVRRVPLAADHPRLARGRILDLPAPPVLPDDSGGVPRRGARGRCSELRILATVVLRLAKPAIVAVALFSILYTFQRLLPAAALLGENRRAGRSRSACRSSASCTRCSGT